MENRILSLVIKAAIQKKYSVKTIQRYLSMKFKIKIDRKALERRIDQQVGQLQMPDLT